MFRPLLVIALAVKLLALPLWLSGHRTSAVLTFFVPDAFLLYAIFMPSAQGLCRVYTRFVAARPSVWLTIDDGPDEEDTPRILDLLDRHQARATFFVIGARAARSPHLIREIVRRGHQVGHHTHTHPVATFWWALPGRIARELDQSLAVLDGNGIRPTLFRAPVGIKPLFLADALARRNLTYLGWSVRSGDCRSHGPEELVAAMTRHLQAGAIILLHEGPSVPAAVRVRGISLLLEEIARRQLACVVPELTQLR